MNSPVAPLSVSEVTNLFSAVLVVSSSTFNLSKAPLFSAVAIVNALGSAFSHFGLLTLGGVTIGIEIRNRVISESCTSGEVVAESHIFDKILKQLLVDSKGILFTSCLVQNPLLVPLPPL